MMKTVFITLATTLSFYRQNKGQGFFVLLGLVLGCSLFTAVAQINASAKASYSEADQVLGASAQLRITDRQFNEVAIDDYISIRRAGFTSVYPVIEARLPSKQGALLSVIATDLLALPFTSSSSSDAVGDNPFSGDGWSRLTQPPFEVWIPLQTAQRLGVQEGDQIVLRNGVRLPPASIRTQAQQNDRLFMDIGAALEILGTDRVSYLAVANLEANERERFIGYFGDRLDLSNNTDALDLSQLTQSLHTNLTALGLLSFVVGVFIVFNAVNFSLHARRQTLDVLRLLGAPRGSVVVAIFCEALLWSLVGALLGTLMAQPLSAALMPAVASTMQNIYGASVSSIPVFNGSLFIQAFALASAGMFLALVLPLWQVISEAGRSQASQRGISLTRRDGVTAIVGGGMLLLAVAGYPYANTVLQGFGLLSLVLFAGITLLPVVILVVVTLGKDTLARGWVGRWAFVDVAYQLPHLRLAMMALLLTLIANIGVSSLVGSFRLALTDWLETRLSADLFVSSQALDQALAQAPENQQLSGQKWLRAAHQRRAVEASFLGRQAEIIGIDVGSPDFLPSSIIDSGPEVFSRWSIAREPVPLVFANEQLRYLGGVARGDTVELATGSGTRAFRVVGFFHDYGNVNFAFHLPSQVMAELYPSASAQGWGLWVAEGGLEAAELALTELGLKPTDWVSQNDVLALSMTIFDRTFAITRALNTLTLIVAAVAIFASLLAIYQFRRTEYALWRALGMDWGQFFWLAGSPLLLMTVVVMLVALPFGVALSWVLIHKINVISFGWTMPVIVDWSSIGFLFTVVSAVVLMAFFLASAGQRSSVNLALKQLAGE